MLVIVKDKENGLCTNFFIYKLWQLFLFLSTCKREKKGFKKR